MSTPNDTAHRTVPVPPPGRATALTDRILVHTGVRDLDVALAYVDDEHSGLWVGATSVVDRLAVCRDFAGPLVADPEAYTTETATPDGVFSLPHDTLYPELDNVLDEQRAAGATVALTPTRYIRANDSASLHELSQQAKRIDRDDTILAVPIAVDWLGHDHIDELTEQLLPVDLPMAVICGGQFDPLEKTPGAVENLRRLEAELPHVMRARTDLSAFDGLAHGSFAGAIGIGGSRRHLVPPGERRLDPRAGNAPGVLVPQLMSYVRSAELAEFYDDETTSPPRCVCGACEGRPLTRFLRPEDRRQANAHNVLIWTDWLHDMLELPSLGARASWWRSSCRAALDQHDIAEAQLGFRAFTPRPALRRYAETPPWSPA